MSTLEVSNVSYSYDARINVVADVSFSIDAGTIVGLVGPNGSGKSTLIKNIFDLLQLQSGSVTLGGHKHTTAVAKAAGIYLASNDYLPEFLSAREFITLIGRLYDIDIDHGAAVGLFRKFSMAGRYDDLIENYSHGMRKKTQLISALLTRRPLTVIDETLNGIDLDALYLAEAELRQLKDEGRSVLLCTHDVSLLERLADRIIFLDLGQLIFDDLTENFTAEHGSLADFVFEYINSEDR